MIAPLWAKVSLPSILLLTVLNARQVHLTNFWALQNARWPQVELCGAVYVHKLLGMRQTCPAHFHFSLKTLIYAYIFVNFNSFHEQWKQTPIRSISNVSRVREDQFGRRKIINLKIVKLLL